MSEECTELVREPLTLSPAQPGCQGRGRSRGPIPGPHLAEQLPVLG